MGHGVPYQGSKQSLIKELAEMFPQADNFYDLFGGGGSVTHYIALTGKYKTVHYNEIDSLVVDVFNKARAGDFSYERFKPEWVSREDFLKYKDSDGYIRCCWSFGNDKRCYLFSKEIEPYKKALHMAVVFNEFDELSEAATGYSAWPDDLKSIPDRRMYVKRKIEEYRKTNTPPKILWKYLSEEQRKHFENIDNLRRLEQLERLERLERLQQLEQLERLQQLEQLERYITTSSKDYREVEILPNSVVYCDIPYKNTKGYGVEFSHDDFFDWAANADFCVLISESNIDDCRFDLIWEKDTRSTLSSTSNSTKKKERLYWNRKEP